MCELQRQKCTTCRIVWTSHKKLSSCESDDPDVRCDDSLCMWAGNPRRPVKGECDRCRDAREKKEEEEEERRDAEAEAKERK